jgi:pectinesterase
MQNTYKRIKVPGAKPALSTRIYGDKSAFLWLCIFGGSRYILWDVSGRHHFSDCYIEGGVDLIYGAGQSFYKVMKICHVSILISTPNWLIMHENHFLSY